MSSVLIVVSGLIFVLILLLISDWNETRFQLKREAEIEQIKADHEYRMKRLEQEERWLDEADNE